LVFNIGLEDAQLPVVPMQEVQRPFCHPARLTRQERRVFKMIKEYLYDPEMGNQQYPLLVSAGGGTVNGL
jgi:hypothetical protein